MAQIMVYPIVHVENIIIFEVGYSRNSVKRIGIRCDVVAELWYNFNFGCAASVHYSVKRRLRFDHGTVCISTIRHR